MRDVFLFIGQSNASGYSPTVTLRLSGQAYPAYGGSPTAPDYVPAYAKTAANEWTGAPPASVDTGTQYAHPSLASAPCLYSQAVNVTTYYDGWGNYVGETPNPSTGIPAPSSGYGLELSFLLSHIAAFPTVPLAAVKHTMGGSSLGDWCPAHTGPNTTGTDGYLWTSLSGITAQAAARLNASEGAGNWRWAALVWMQGESGAHGGQTDDSAYLSGARAFFAAVRSLLGRADLPVVVGRIGDNWGWEATPNPYLATYGNPYQAIDYSITSSGQTVTDPRRASYLGSAVLRRATQVTLGGDPRCAWWDNDGYPLRPPVSLTAANNDATGYHWGGPGNLAGGERAFAAYRRAFTARVRVETRGGRFRARGVA